jgi:hypothetical protein
VLNAGAFALPSASYAGLPIAYWGVLPSLPFGLSNALVLKKLSAKYISDPSLNIHDHNLNRIWLSRIKKFNPNTNYKELNIETLYLVIYADQKLKLAYLRPIFY